MITKAVMVLTNPMSAETHMPFTGFSLSQNDTTETRHPADGEAENRESEL